MSPAAGHRQPAEDSGRVRIPADVDRPDKLLVGLTARQLAILAVAALVLWAGYAATRHLVPPAVYGALAVPLAASAALLALGRMEGVPADRWVLAAWRQHRSAHRLVPAPGGVPAPPSVLAEVAGPRLAAPPAPLRLPLAGIDANGVVDLGPDGMAVICRASAVTFSLRTAGEQEALVAGFARFLSSLAEPVQILVRAEHLDVGPAIAALLDAAPGLPHVALERAARDHAAFIGDLAASRDLLCREVLVVLRQPARAGDAEGDGAGRLLRRAAEAVSALAAAGVSLSVLDATAASTDIARSLDPGSPPRPTGSSPASGIDEPVTLARPRPATASFADRSPFAGPATKGAPR